MEKEYAELKDKERREQRRIAMLQVLELTPKKQLVKKYKTLTQAAIANGLTNDEMYKICNTINAKHNGHLFMAY